MPLVTFRDLAVAGIALAAREVLAPLWRHFLERNTSRFAEQRDVALKLSRSMKVLAEALQEWARREAAHRTNTYSVAADLHEKLDYVRKTREDWGKLNDQRIETSLPAWFEEVDGDVTFAGVFLSPKMGAMALLKEKPDHASVHRWNGLGSDMASNAHETFRLADDVWLLSVPTWIRPLAKRRQEATRKRS